jgi:L-asparagine transporter-like permease
MNPEFVVPVAMFACVFGILYVYFTTRNRERMAMIEKGADPSLFRNPNRGGRSTLKFGLLFVGVSLGILMGAILTATIPGILEETANFSMIFLFGGIALIVSHVLDSKAKSDAQDRKDPMS